MQAGKTISAYIAPEKITRLDSMRGNIPRSQALTKILDYVLAQDDTWIKSFLGTNMNDSSVVPEN